MNTQWCYSIKHVPAMFFLRHLEIHFKPIIFYLFTMAPATGGKTICFSSQSRFYCVCCMYVRLAKYVIFKKKKKLSEYKTSENAKTTVEVESINCWINLLQWKFLYRSTFLLRKFVWNSWSVIDRKIGFEWLMVR